MNYYAARQHVDGGWHFTCRNDERVYPVGPCREHRPHPERVDAERCYYEHVMGLPVRVSDPVDGPWSSCARCDGPTRRQVDFDGYHVLIVGPVAACEACVPDEDTARALLRERRPFTDGSEITSSY